MHFLKKPKQDDLSSFLIKLDWDTWCIEALQQIVDIKHLKYHSLLIFVLWINKNWILHEAYFLWTLNQRSITPRRNRADWRQIFQHDSAVHAVRLVKNQRCWIRFLIFFIFSFSSHHNAIKQFAEKSSWFVSVVLVWIAALSFNIEAIIDRFMYSSSPHWRGNGKQDCRGNI